MIHMCYVRLQANNNIEAGKKVPKMLPEEQATPGTFLSIACTRKGTESVFNSVH